MMRTITIAAVVWMCATCAHAYDVLRWQGREANLMTNGGFETASDELLLAADWVAYLEHREPDKEALVERSEDAHSGGYSAHLKAEGTNLVGLNRAYEAGVDAGSMIPVIRGWAEFWYKAISSETGENLRVHAIVLPADGSRESGRRTFTIPAEHVGDGEWHKGVLYFDFSGTNEAPYIQLAPRINEGGAPGQGEFLIDDIAVYKGGASVGVEVGGFSRAIAQVGQSVKLRSRVRNLTDAPAEGLRASVKLTGPAEIAAESEIPLPVLEPKQEGTFEWDVRITGLGPVTARVTVAGDDFGRTSWPAAMTAIRTDTGGEVAIETASARIRYIPQTDKWGILAVDAKPGDAEEWTQAGIMPTLGWAAVGESREVLAFPASKSAAAASYWTSEVHDRLGTLWFASLYATPGKAGQILLHARLSDGDRTVYNFTSPWLLLGADAGKREACLPGLEYLTAEESSSNELDGHHPLNLRWAPHPNKVTIPFMSVSFDWGTAVLAWNPLQKCDGVIDRPQPVFAAPNRLGDQPRHLLSLAVPGGIENRAENMLEAHTGCGGEDAKLDIVSELAFVPGANTDAALAWYLDTRELPPDPPMPRSFEDSLRLSLDSSESRWVEDSTGWYSTSAWSRGAAPSPVLARVLWIDSLRTADETKRDLWRKRATAAATALAGNVGLDTGLFLGDIWNAVETAAASAREAADGQLSEGGWGYDGGAIMPEWNLGEKGKAVSGTTARYALSLLQFAAATGDEMALQAGLRALEFCNEFDPIPRGGQTWEVPLHTPDLIVAGQTLMAHILAYEITGDEQWIEMGRHWAYTSIPFIYLWKAPERPIMPYATIPVIGTSAWTNPWYGRPVQWCGIVMIEPLLRFAEYDETEDWAAIARRLTITSIQQQLDANKRLYPDTKDTPEKELYWFYPAEDMDRRIGLYCDNYTLYDTRDYCWGYMLSPNSHTPLTEGIMSQLGIQSRARSKILHTDDGLIHVTAPVPIEQATFAAGDVTVSLRNPDGWPVRVMVSLVSSPAQVLADGRPVAQGDVREQGAEAWGYHSTRAICIVQTRGSAITLKGVSNRVSRPVDKATMTAWEFDGLGEAQGFVAEHAIGRFAVSDGRLKITVTGQDPSFAIHGLRLAATQFRALRVRLSATGERDSNIGVFFSRTGEGSSAEREVNVPLTCDGEMREIVIPLGNHPLWNGTITAIRLDPTHGLNAAEVEIDWIRFE